MIFLAEQLLRYSCTKEMVIWARGGDRAGHLRCLRQLQPETAPAVQGFFLR